MARWERSLGMSMGGGVGFAPLDEPDAPLLNKFGDLLFEYAGRLYESELLMFTLERREYA